MLDIEVNDKARYLSPEQVLKVNSSTFDNRVILTIHYHKLNTDYRL